MKYTGRYHQYEGLDKNNLLPEGVQLGVASGSAFIQHAIANGGTTDLTTWNHDQVQCFVKEIVAGYLAACDIASKEIPF